MTGAGEHDAAQTPLVSVVIPTYNSAGFVTETIESVLAQTYPHWELVVVDDGSTDDTLAVIRACGVPDAQLSLLSMSHGGAGAARNHAIERARGELIAFLDHDDVWLPHKLAVQVETLLRGPCDVVASDWYRIGFGDEPRLRLDERLYSGAEMFSLLWDFSRFPPSAVLATKAAVTRAGMFGDERVGGEFMEDYGLWLRLAQDGCTFAAVKQLSWGYRVRETSRSGDVLEMREGDLALLSTYAEEMARIDPERYRRRIAGLLDGIAVLRAEIGDVPGARRALAQLRGLQGERQIRVKMLALALLRRRYAVLMRRVRRGDMQLANIAAFRTPPQPPS